MKLINSNFKILEQEHSIQGISEIFAKICNSYDVKKTYLKILSLKNSLKENIFKK